MSKEETFGLMSQIRRVPTFISSNISEGRDGSSSKEPIRFLEMVVDSSCELETMILISVDLGFLEKRANFIFSQEA